MDRNFRKQEKKEQLLQPFHLKQLVLAPPPGYVGTFQEPVIVTKQERTITISGVIQGRILTPQQAVAHLRPLVESEHDHEVMEMKP
ncbi:hypothetical protein KSD_17260 [Ktedonobacter sp. SOSP1-85]|uniref:hypothetical protein n=1 Tax=Ktedonobacter sp. SOSP1-85 TaxID=2778367 RepID=UPI001916AA36|nr:hypothetical protein [Ktedonobacter sp. SOSP1-85]GHO73955.1 hypothetical protein KSD_17260 [Ktedonobacter sp. SOSP1-85]